MNEDDSLYIVVACSLSVLGLETCPDVFINASWKWSWCTAVSNGPDESDEKTKKCNHCQFCKYMFKPFISLFAISLFSSNLIYELCRWYLKRPTMHWQTRPLYAISLKKYNISRRKPGYNTQILLLNTHSRNSNWNKSLSIRL